MFKCCCFMYISPINPDDMEPEPVSIDGLAFKISTENRALVAFQRMMIGDNIQIWTDESSYQGEIRGVFRNLSDDHFLFVNGDIQYVFEGVYIEILGKHTHLYLPTINRLKINDSKRLIESPELTRHFLS